MRHAAAAAPGPLVDTVGWHDSDVAPAPPVQGQVDPRCWGVCWLLDDVKVSVIDLDEATVEGGQHELVEDLGVACARCLDGKHGAEIVGVLGGADEPEGSACLVDHLDFAQQGLRLLVHSAHATP